MWLHQPAGEVRWLLVDGVADVAGGGLIHGHSRIWTEDARSIATGGSILLYAPRRPA